MDDAIRCLLHVPADMQRPLADDIIGRADLADRYRKRNGRRHPMFGDGTLAAATSGLEKVTKHGFMTDARLAALGTLVDALRERRRLYFCGESVICEKSARREGKDHVADQNEPKAS